MCFCVIIYVLFLDVIQSNMLLFFVAFFNFKRKLIFILILILSHF